MAFSLTWLPFVLRQAGLKVAEVAGWETRGRGEMDRVLGVICHHTGHTSGEDENLPSESVLVNGRRLDDGGFLPGPLAQLGLGRDGTYYVIAAGRANHAGTGDWRGITAGNRHFIGIEAENRGRQRDVYPPVQLDAYHRGVAAILKHVGREVDFCIGHKEWARNRTQDRKVDPLFDMSVFRTRVTAILNGSAPPPVLIPVVDPRGRPTLRRGHTGPAVRELRAALERVLQSSSRPDLLEALATEAVDAFGPHTEAAVRAAQRMKGLVPDGIVGPKTWAALA